LPEIDLLVEADIVCDKVRGPPFFVIGHRSVEEVDDIFSRVASTAWASQATPRRMAAATFSIFRVCVRPQGHDGHWQRSSA